MNYHELDPSAYGWELPAGWKLYAYEPGGEPAILKATYELTEGCVAVVEAHVHAPYNGPTRVTLLAESEDAANQSDGITTEMMRSVPLGEARKVITYWVNRIRSELSPESLPAPLPERISTPEDYARVASEYVRLVNSNERRPIEVMAQAWGVSKNTASSRLRRAREKGYLIQMEHSQNRLSAILSEKAEEILTRLNKEGR
ncbi:hypothetical protein AB0I72_04155 [Nocardiopsis sp. NPDC049922]|uniref:hypothetical protein n=1 Tax=Nocardiopsis sp. NPDC049922 TaxID=3155157 RepID=UPI00340A0411